MGHGLPRLRDRQFLRLLLPTRPRPRSYRPKRKKSTRRAERNSIRKGNDLFNDKKYTEAEIEYRKALEANPSSEIATYNLGAALYKQQKWNDSRNEYKKIVQASSDTLRTAHAWHNLGNISFQEKNYAQSIEEYKNALRRNPKDDETRYNLRLAQLLLKKQQQDQNQDKNKDQQDQNKDQQKDQKQQNQDQNKNNQNKQNQDQKDNQQQNNPQQQQPQQSQMSRGECPTDSRCHPARRARHPGESATGFDAAAKTQEDRQGVVIGVSNLYTTER